MSQKHPVFTFATNTNKDATFEIKGTIFSEVLNLGLFNRNQRNQWTSLTIFAVISCLSFRGVEVG